jgi:putative ABC transport system permease protein
MRFDLRPGVRRVFRLPLSTRAATDRDTDDELESFIASRVEYLVARGMSPGDARAEALRRLGASLDDARLLLHASATQRERRMRLTEFLDSVRQDVHYAARGLVRRPAFTAVSVLTLAIGVGATTAIFSAVNVLLLRALPYARPDELMKISLFVPAQGDYPRTDMGWSYPMFTMFRDAQRSFSDLTVYRPLPHTLTTGDAERVTGEYVGATYLRVLGLSPSRGRDFDRALDAHAGGPHEVIVSYVLWHRRFNADPSIIGRTIGIDGEPWTIIGVGPRDFRGLSGQADLLLPATIQPAAQMGPQWFNHSLVARRGSGVTQAQAAQATIALGAQVAKAYPNPMGKLNWEVTASPLDDARLEPLIKRSLLVLFGAVGLVLLITCVNVANLLLGRATARAREIAVRVAIGAGRARVIRLLLTESLLLALSGAFASVAVAWAGVHALGSIDPSAIFRSQGTAVGAIAFSSIALDWRALTFTFAVSLVVGILFGLAPAFAATGDSLSGALKSDRGSWGRGAGAGRRVLVVAEVALALVLLAGSGLMIRSLAKLLATNGGFDANNVLTFRLTPTPGSIQRDSMPGFYSEILDRVRAIPGVTDAALSSGAPMSGHESQTFFSRTGAAAADMNSLIEMTWVTPTWFSLMRVPLERGRLFTVADRASAPQVMVLNESAARRFFGNEDPIGKHVTLGMGGITNAEVIGVVAGVRQRPDSTPPATAYVSYAQSPRPSMMVFVRASRDVASIGNEIRRAVHDVAPQLPVYDMVTMTQRTALATAQARFRAVLLTAFAITALSLAVIGIYGVMSFAVTARTREIGVRIALGAEAGSVHRLVIGEGIGLVGVGAVIGLAGALVATRVLRSFLFDLTPSDPITYTGVVVMLGAAAILASWIPARRAARVDPVVALRAE